MIAIETKPLGYTTDVTVLQVSRIGNGINLFAMSSPEGSNESEGFYCAYAHNHVAAQARPGDKGQMVLRERIDSLRYWDYQPASVLMQTDKCDFCGHIGPDVRLISDGTDSGESDLYCATCRTAPPASGAESEE